MTSALHPESSASVLAMPADAPPPGVSPNFHDPPTLHKEMYILLAVTWTLMTLSLAMRLFTRWYVVKLRMIEDYLIIVAWALGITNGVVCIICAKHGSGVHMWDQSLAMFERGTKYIRMAGMVYGVLVGFVKVAILIQCLRIFAPGPFVNRPIYFTCWASIIVTTLFYIAFEVLVGIECLPFFSGQCLVKTITLFFTSSVFNLVSDVLILILPLLAIYKLHMNLKEKTMIASLFAAGALACSASTLRIYYSVRIDTDRDTSWNYAFLGICSWFEVSLGIVVFCLPVLPGFIKYSKARLEGKSLRAIREQRHRADDPPQANWERKAFETPQANPPDSLGISTLQQHLKPEFISTNDFSDQTSGTMG